MPEQRARRSARSAPFDWPEGHHPVAYGAGVTPSIVGEFVDVEARADQCLDQPLRAHIGDRTGQTCFFMKAPIVKSLRWAQKSAQTRAPGRRFAASQRAARSYSGLCSKVPMKTAPSKPSKGCSGRNLRKCTRSTVHGSARSRIRLVTK